MQDGNFMSDVSCQNNINQHVNILNGKYVNYNFKFMSKTFNKLNKLISVQFNNEYLLIIKYGICTSF